MALALAILKVISSIPEIGKLIEKIIAAHMASLDEKRRKNIEDASIDMSKAKTTEERRAALDKWFHGGGN